MNFPLRAEAFNHLFAIECKPYSYTPAHPPLACLFSMAIALLPEARRSLFPMRANRDTLPAYSSSLESKNLATLEHLPTLPPPGRQVDSRSQFRRERLFYIAIAVIAVAVVFAGFAPTYYLKARFGNPPLRPLVHLHGFLFSLWLVLLASQVTLVAAHRTDLHRRLGIFGGVLAALLVIIGPIVAIQSARLGAPPNRPPGLPPPLIFLVIPLFDIAIFAIVVAAGFYYRRRADIHKRLMVVATIAILPPAIARLHVAFLRAHGPLAFFGLADLFLLACILYDTIRHRRLHPAYVWAGLLLIASHPLRLLIGGTASWLAFAHWLTR